MIWDRLDLSALAPYWHRGRQWWSTRSLREQVLLGTLAVIAILALLFALVINPLRDARNEALARIRSADIIEARLSNGAEGFARSVAFRTGSVSAIVANSTAAAQLEMGRIESIGTDSRIVFENVPFNSVMNWVADIERNTALQVRDVAITGESAPGFVTATVTIGE